MEFNVKMIYQERNEFCEEVLEHRIDQNGKSIETREMKKNVKHSVVKKAEIFMKNAFLPQGYPHSVSKDYLSYQIWDTIQAFASSISGSLATQVSISF